MTYSKQLIFVSNGDGTCSVREVKNLKVKKIVIPKKSPDGDIVVRIGLSAFCGCKDLKTIKIPESVTSIGWDAFSNCSSLTSIEIPASVRSIGDYAFMDCSSLQSVTFIGNSQLTSIAKDTFYGCTSLTNIEMPSSITNIGWNAFSGCLSLQKKGYFKATTKNMTCRDFQYTIGEWYEKPNAILCKEGFHYCENAFDLFKYYYGIIGKDVRFFEVEVAEVSEEKSDDSKRVCKKIKLVREITSYKELLN